jgi:hypothetical protein
MTTDQTTVPHKCGECQTADPLSQSSPASCSTASPSTRTYVSRVSRHSCQTRFSSPLTKSQRKGVFYWPLMICLFIGIAVYIIALSTLNTGARYFAMMFTAISNGQYLRILSSPSPCRPEKRIIRQRSVFRHLEETYRVAGPSLIRHSRPPVVPLQHNVTPHRPTLPQARGRTRSDERYWRHVERVGQLRVGLGSEASVSVLVLK